ncbi:hypothetical protein DMB66_43345 [Actinoplanes sp. ATCC 53533]|uniref:hypothetical protein n=1 Tax=Actinoplanes sp. ATCC 53533 TaxID=1288362 RepID=UPI000F7AEEF3|nr:hypothetical protein [Actinoplanes sp. ATCC 53533]RSM50439.1 hypothetical protein DMB66_43345 [Actinoplanes sp. ATCC 53533]
MSREISSAVPGEWTPGAELAATAEALAALCWLLSQPAPGQPGPAGRTAGTVATIRGATIRDLPQRRHGGGRLATDPGA